MARSTPAAQPARIRSRRGSGPSIAGRIGLAVVLGTALSSSALSAQETFTVEDVLSAPFPSELVASPAEDRVAWVMDAEGERNVWTASAPDWRPRRITGYLGDDGQPLTGLRFTPDGARLLYTRGGAPNRRGWVPNPESLPEPRDRSVRVVSVDGDEGPWELEGVNGPVLSPDGGRVAHGSGGKILVRELEEGAEDRVVAEPRSGGGGLVWSPDGTRLAFVSGRGDHAFVGVLDPERQTLRYLDPGVDHDGSPVWSPDGRRIAFVRRPNERDRLPFSPRREAHPWSIRVVELASGRAREVWRADEGPGSVFQGVTGENLMWAAGDRLVFPWEGNGWLNLYSVPASGGEATALNPGEHEVQFVSLAPDGRTVLYDSNEGDVDRKHVWRVSVDGSSGPQLLTPGDGIEWGAVETGAGSVAFLGSGATSPARVYLLAEDGRTAVSGDLPDHFPGGELVAPRQVVFPAADGLLIHGQLFMPDDVAPGETRPGMLFFHGGSRRQMLLGFHHRGYYHNAYAFNQYLASLGYVVLSVNYRSGIGYGMEFREALQYGARGASEYNDVTGAGVYLAGLPEVDPERIGLWGGSYGGYLTALGLARASDLFAAGVDFHGVHDWNVVIRNFVPSYRAEIREDFARVAFESSPMAYMDGWRSPVLLIHGDDDRNVPFSETVDLVESLRARDVEFEQLVFPDEVHGFLLHRSWVRAYEAAADFLERKLGPAETIR